MTEPTEKSPYKYIDNPDLLCKVFGIDINIELKRLEEIQRKEKQQPTSRKCFVCKQMFEAYFPKTRKCSACELDNRANV